MLNHKLRILFVLFLVLLLVLIRAFEDILFYDPFLNYFKMDYTNLPLPKIDNFLLFYGLCFRFFLNTILSLAIIHAIFNDFELTKFVAFLYVFLFIILMTAFFAVLSFMGEQNKMTLFYIRRFLIQPLFLLLFVPAFYYQKLNK